MEIIIRPQMPVDTKATLMPDFTACAWLVMDVYTIEDARAIAKTTDSIKVKPANITFKFLLPEEFSESVQHTWGDYDGITSQLASKFLPIVQKGLGAASIVGNGIGAAKSYSGSGLNTTQSLGLATDTAASVESVVNMRYDTAYTYKGSSRRVYNFAFEFGDLGDPYMDVVYPIKKLEFLSTPEIAGGFAQIQKPNIFKLWIESNRKEQPWINLEHAALTQVTPTYYGPYRGGLPTKASVQLTFTEIDPLYRSQFLIEIEKATTANRNSRQERQQNIDLNLSKAAQAFENPFEPSYQG